MLMKNKASLFWGVVLIIVGVLFLGNNLDWWSINIFFDGWWSLFIIVPSIYGLIDSNSRGSSVISLALGILLLLAAQDIIDWSMIWKILVPIIIIVIGFTLIFGMRSKRKIDKNAREYVAVFAGVEEKIKEIVSDFKVVSIFGGVDLDLRKAEIKKDLYIEALTIFGGIDIKLPDNVKVKCEGVPIFGGVENRYSENAEEGITITIHYTCVFGGIDII